MKPDSKYAFSYEENIQYQDPAKNLDHSLAK